MSNSYVGEKKLRKIVMLSLFKNSFLSPLK